jgi:hypothetical protein
VAGQAVASPLELRERQQTRAGHGLVSAISHVRRGVVWEGTWGDVRERTRDDRRAFALEPLDLASQGIAHIALGDLDTTSIRRTGSDGADDSVGASTGRRPVVIPIHHRRKLSHRSPPDSA